MANAQSLPSWLTPYVESMGCPSSGSITVTQPTWGYVNVNVGVAQLTIDLRGVRISNWYIPANGGQLAAYSPPRGSLAHSYPLYDWLPAEDWPGTLATSTWNYTVAFNNGSLAVLEFTLTEYNDQQLGGASFTMVKYLVFCWGKYYFLWISNITNIGSVVLNPVPYWAPIGYTLADTGVVGSTASHDFQAFMNGNDIYVYGPGNWQNWVRMQAPELRWVAIINPYHPGGLVLAIEPYNASYSVWLESDFGGLEVRIEYPAFQLQPGQHLVFVAMVYGGPFNEGQMDAVNLSSLYRESEALAQQASYAVAVSTNQVVYEPGQAMRITVSIRSGVGANGTLMVRIAYLGTQLITSPSQLMNLGNVVYTYSEPVAVEPGNSSFTVNATAPSQVGAYVVQAAFEPAPGSAASGAATLIAVSEPSYEIYAAFFLHDHQGTDYLPNGVYFSCGFDAPWAFYNVWGSSIGPCSVASFSPFYSYGAYYVQAYILSQYPQIHMTIELSPPLLWQWWYGLHYGIYVSTPTGMVYIPPNSTYMHIVGRTLQMFVEMAERGQIEIATSFFDHPIAGFLVAYFGPKWLPLLYADAVLGREVTQLATGVDAAAFWVPEMWWDDELAPILARAGARIIVLDAQYEYNGAQGQLDGIYVPYTLTVNGSGIVVLFRDTELSNLLSFTLNNVNSPSQADLNARILVVDLVLRGIRHPGGIDVIAMDGENWMIFAPNPPWAAVLFNNILYYLSQAQALGIVRTVTLSQAIRLIPPTHRLTYVPTQTWAGSPSLWYSTQAQAKMWGIANEALDCWLSNMGRLGANSTIVAWMIMHLIDSDHYYSTFLDEDYVTKYWGPATLHSCETGDVPTWVYSAYHRLMDAIAAERRTAILNTSTIGVAVGAVVLAALTLTILARRGRIRIL